MMRAARAIEFPAYEGYPADYVVARLCARRGMMPESLEALLMAARPALPARYAARGAGGPEEAVAVALRRELWWVARQMDDGLREVFRPVYAYFELGTLFSCIRFKARRDTGEEVDRALALSLLSPALKDALRGAGSQAAAMEAAAGAFVRRPGAYWRRATAKARKPADAEQKLTDDFLAEAACGASHGVIRGFFRAVIDMRNVVSAYKRLRWGMEAAPPMIGGGDIEPSRLRGLASEAALLSAVGRLAGLGAAERPSDVERLFLRRLLQYSKGAARRAGAVGVVLDYLLRCQREARNLGLVFAGQALDRDLLRGELVT